MVEMRPILECNEIPNFVSVQTLAGPSLSSVGTEFEPFMQKGNFTTVFQGEYDLAVKKKKKYQCII